MATQQSVDSAAATGEFEPAPELFTQVPCMTSV